MKKFLLGSVLFLLVMGCSYLIYREYSFSPLKKGDFQKIFVEQNISFNNSCSKDFLGISSGSELFEIYLYNVKGGIISKEFPKITEWEHKEITDKVVVGKWKNCPIDSQTMVLYKFALKANDFDKVKCFNSFNKEVLNPTNYYCFVHFNDLEQYFLLYCTDCQELYYIRRKGF
ncbi:hypothetical protein SAMN05518672_106201 [Chitinophaga sp. CF118]|uniref:hypothetical protein n=1 Tax=Chitinophaga sp. CF118 TaxID=1884367 RepID=UPI0008ECBA4A|nr:hypothetical protein [Chitinophaga sp. CF118]SFE46018.1 hypothetical protein SAMN05518672_106201 [Chitinophaga sp. CF118]